MGNTITINPVTRISGFLEITVEVENNIITNAKSSGLLFRGFEKMLQNRPPLDSIYFTERICGICSTAHSMASTLALEDALQVIPNENDAMLRDFIHSCEFLQNHLRHFYQYTLPDFIKGPNVHPLYDTSHHDFRLPDDLNKKLESHYLASIQYSRLAHEMLATLAGKAPHNHGIFVGGVTVNIDASKYIKVKSMLHDIKQFVIENTLEDVQILAEYYKDYFHNGIGYKNLMSGGLFYTYKDPSLQYVQPKVLLQGELQNFHSSKITENIYHAWYESALLDRKPTDPTINENLSKDNAYTWIKAPRYQGLPVEVGPLARLYLSGDYTHGISTMDRTIARVLEIKKLIEIMESLLEKITLQPAAQTQYQIPHSSKGVGIIDTTRGTLGHWISIESQRIKNYEIITPTAWNLSPEDDQGVKGVIEYALLGTEIQDLRHPVEIGRIVRSFDPCVSCATHVSSDSYSSIEMRIV